MVVDVTGKVLTKAVGVEVVGAYNGVVVDNVVVEHGVEEDVVVAEAKHEEDFEPVRIWLAYILMIQVSLIFC